MIPFIRLRRDLDSLKAVRAGLEHCQVFLPAHAEEEPNVKTEWVYEGWTQCPLFLLEKA